MDCAHGIVSWALSVSRYKKGTLTALLQRGKSSTARMPNALL
jgi:hypothetical protein